VITVNHQPAPGYLFLENAGQGGFRYAMILDNDGSPLWPEFRYWTRVLTFFAGRA